MSDFEYREETDEIEVLEEQGSETGRPGRKVEHWPVGTVQAHLMNGVVYGNESPVVYNDLIYHLSVLQGRFHDIGLKVEVNEKEQYAYLRSLGAEEFGDGPMPPRLLKQIQLPFMISFLIMQLQLKVNELENQGEGRFIISFDEMYERMDPYFKPGGDEGVKRRQLSGQVTRLCELGVLRKISSRDKDADNYEIKRIIKTVCNAQKLELFKQKLESYLAEAARKSGRSSEGDQDE